MGSGQARPEWDVGWGGQGEQQQRRGRKGWRGRTGRMVGSRGSQISSCQGRSETGDGEGQDGPAAHRCPLLPSTVALSPRCSLRTSLNTAFQAHRLKPVCPQPHTEAEMRKGWRWRDRMGSWHWSTDEARAGVAAAGQKEGSTESTPETESTLIK